MSGRADREHDGLEPALTAWMAMTRGSQNSPCLDANELAAFAGSRLLEVERRRAEEHLAVCRDCRAAVALALRAEGRAGDAAPRTTTARASRRTWWIAAAAAVLVAGVLILTRPDAPPPTTDALLMVHAEQLVKQHPDLFEGFTPLSEDERLARGDVLKRGGIWLETPAGTTLSRVPTFIWSSGREATLVISTRTGQAVLRVESVTSPWAWPAGQPLDRGQTYLVELETEGVLGTERLSRTFTVAAQELATQFERQVAAVEAAVPKPDRSLLLAHVALRHQLLDEARRHAEAYVAKRRGEPVGRETLFQVLTRIGHPGAAAVLETR